MRDAATGRRVGPEHEHAAGYDGRGDRTGNGGDNGERWARWACWTVLIADVAYTLTFGRYDPTIHRQSFIADVALPVPLLAQLHRFFGGRRLEGG